MRLRPFRILSFLHRWLGLPITALFLITLGSAQYLATERLIERSDRHGQRYVVAGADMTGEHVARLLSENPQTTNIALPRPDAPFYRLSNRGDVAIFSAADLDLLHQSTRADNAFRRWVLGLHRNYLKGPAGRDIVAVVSILAVLISIIGVVAWYPYRRVTRLRDLAPRTLSRAVLFRAHFTMGLAALAVIVLLGVTGAAITYRSLAGDLLGARGADTRASLEAPHYVPRNWSARLQLAQDYFPEARLAGISRLSAPTRAGATLEIRFSGSGDWNQLGSNAVLLNETDSSFVEIRRYSEIPFGVKLYQMIRPLHDGSSMPVGYLWFLFIANGLLIVMVATGLLSFLQKTYRPLRLPDMSWISVMRRAGRPTEENR